MDILDFILSKLQQIPNLIIAYAPRILLALIIFYIGRAVVRKLSSTTVAASEKIETIDATLARFFGSVVLFAGMAAVLIAALSAAKINLAFLASIIAAMLLALGFALQDTLGDVASGIMLVVFRPYKVGDEVEINGEKGVVTQLGLFTTRMLTRDNIELIVSNSDAIGNTIKNYYDYGSRRLDMDFGVSYNTDIGKAIEAITGACQGDDRILPHPEGPWAKVVALGDSAIIIQLRVWCPADEYRHVKMDMSGRVKATLDAAGIEIPYEHNMIIPMKVSANVSG
jgi:small conductance mechanosensitive channel